MKKLSSKTKRNLLDLFRISSAVILIGAALFLGIEARKYWNSRVRKSMQNSCFAAYDVLCEKVKDCSSITAEQCKTVVVAEGYCEGPLPKESLIRRCEEDLKYLSCDSQLPVSCMIFMKD